MAGFLLRGRDCGALDEDEVGFPWRSGSRDATAASRHDSPDMTPAIDLVLRSRRIVAAERDAAGRGLHRRVGASRPSRTTTTPGQDLGDLALLPGLVDPHVHVNEPGRTDWEGFATATRAAAAGGVTTIIDMPLNCLPPTRFRRTP